MSDKQHITIQIADAGHLDLNIEREEEEDVRNTVSKVNMLWSQWCNQFPQRSTKDVLAMVAYQYARKYYSMVDAIAAQDSALAQVDNALDQILLDVK